MRDGANLAEPRQIRATKGACFARLPARSPVLENTMYVAMIPDTYARVPVRRADAFGR